MTEGTAELRSGRGATELTSAPPDGTGPHAAETAVHDQPEVDVAAAGARLAEAIGRVVEGKPDVVRLALVVLLAEGHLLIEDVPGVGKTTLAKALARTIDGTVRRIQFTPDLLPSDVTGVAVYDQESRAFEFKPGAVFANVVVADEINRASPKTQSALLECMEERQVTVDGVTYELARPFIVVATQNPQEMEGTYPLPEAQRDRFTARVSMGYPDRDAELAMLDERATTDPLTALSPVIDAAGVRALVAAVGRLHVAEPLRRYVVSLVEATRRSPDLRLGASPRAGLQLLRAARATAALAGRDHVLPDDVQAMAVPVLAHRLLLTPDAALARRDTQRVVTDLLAAVPVQRGH
ncbi:AAA family ATPase [Modestobacter italicus]|uniref:AAA family ATPase n=1 Tax=Modestobacter italicus (strain DSM 44449 / CECT 9708 / BC 501) TaxID=2732864 RepID=UPI003F769F7F